MVAFLRATIVLPRAHVSVTLRLYTDFVCPFCFIAEESTVPALLRDYDIELDWHGFELHPGTPKGGVPLTSLFPGAHLPSLHERTRRFGADFGLAEFDPPNVLKNSRRALAMAEFARAQGQLESYRRTAFDAHWRRHQDLEADADLKRLAIDVGLDPDAALAAADDASYLAQVDEKQSAARAEGISGIPTFVFGDLRVVGCQPLPALASAAGRAGAQRRDA